ncbi:MAG: type pilus assembly protein PilQ [Acidobacteriota bacterium]|jgi:type IV pilus assembly protein PilQ|nr:type pilus assembly protein PilQ [Acidobacteriota bacterium]
MGDVVITKQYAGFRRWIASAVVLTVAVGAGCTASRPARVIEASPAASATSATMAPKQAQAPVENRAAQSSTAEIRSLDLREGAPEVFIDLEASAPLVWTSFRNAEGRVIVELPNAVPRAGLADLSPADGLISSLAIQKSEEGSRPMTRLVIATRQEVEHSVTADGAKLRIQLLPLGEQAKAKLAFEPLGEETASNSPGATGTASTPPSTGGASGASSSSSTSAESAALGTAEKPAVAPAPSGVAATRLDAIEVLSSDGGAVIRIAGDGEFPYSTFALSEPRRFVIDLDGVINRAQRTALSLDSSVVERVRVAQFKPAPKPVSRVVFDLRRDTVPVIERTQEALVVSFPPSAQAVGSRGAASPAESPEPAAPAPAPPVPAPAPPAPVPAQAPVQAPVKTVAAVHAPAPAPHAPAVAPARVQDSAPAASAPAPRLSEAEPSDLVLAQRQPAPAPAGTGKPTTVIQSSQTPGGKVVVQPRPAGSPAGSVASGGRPSAGPVEVSSVQQTPAASILQPKSSGEKERTYVGEPIDLKVTNADVTDVLRTFAQISGLNIIVQPGVNGVVTAELENVPWDQALEQILKINNLDYELDGNVMRIAPTSVLRQEAQDRQQLAAAKALAIPLRTVYQRLSYAQAGDVASLLKTGQAGLLSQRGSVVVDARTNALIIKELPSNMDAVLSVIDLLDAPEPQVMIEARIVETTKRFSRDLGIRWGFNAIADAAHGNTTGLVFPSNGTASGGVNLAGNGNNGVLNLKLGNVLNTFNLDVALQAAESEGLITILSAPKVATLNNQRASIQSGLQIPVQTVLNNTVTVQFINATLRLDVTPQVTAEGTVLMDIDISKREPQTAFLLPGATNAPIATKDARTRLVVRDGGTAVIGGIYKITSNNGENRVPGLGNIPIIGYLFKNKTRSDENDELLIFITPRVIKI